MPLLLFLLLFTDLNALDYKPWFGIHDEAQIRANVLFQSYNEVALPHRSYKHPGRDLFYSLTASYPFMRYSGEFEALGIHTAYQKWTLDCVRIFGRYMYLDQTLGSWCNMAIGLDVGEALKRAVNDLASALSITDESRGK